MIVFNYMEIKLGIHRVIGCVTDDYVMPLMLL